MNWNLLFFFNSVLLGVGLAMDAFSVSLANGLNEPAMHKKKMCRIAGIFAIFQGIMPLIGWICVHTILQYFKIFEKCIPWIALLLLLFIGGKMLMEGIKNKEDDTEVSKIEIFALLVQGIATSIDALSVGFTIAEYN
nr:manganese efflux pump MntP family protein [Lachnospiraceae bacterium]